MSPKQRALLDFIAQWIGAHGYPPSYDEMMAGMKTGKSNIHRLLHGLAAQGQIKITPRRKRSLQLVKPDAVRLHPEIMTLTDEYARAHGISRETAANELLRGALGAV